MLLGPPVNESNETQNKENENSSLQTSMIPVIVDDQESFIFGQRQHPMPRWSRPLASLCTPADTFGAQGTCYTNISTHIVNIKSEDTKCLAESQRPAQLVEGNHYRLLKDGGKTVVQRPILLTKESKTNQILYNV